MRLRYLLGVILLLGMLGGVLALLAAGAVCLGGGPAFAQAVQEDPAAADPLDEIERLRARLEARFELLPLRDGVVLRPKTPGLPWRSLEVRGRETAVDGAAVTPDELEIILGADAPLVAELLALAPDAQRDLALEAPDPERQERVRRIELTLPPLPPLPPMPAPPKVPEIPKAPRVTTEQRVVMGGRVEIARHEVSQGVVVFGGSAKVEGEVKGDVVVIGGQVEIDGRVDGDAVVVGGRLTLGPNARVSGDAVAVGGRVRRDPGATVRGKVVDVSWGPVFTRAFTDGKLVQMGLPRDQTRRAMRLVQSLTLATVLLLISWLLVLIGRRPLERIQTRLRTSPIAAGFTGLGVQLFFLPVLVVLTVALAISVIGIPVLILLWPLALLALALGLVLGYAGAAYGLARWTESRFGWNVPSPYLAVLIGVVLIQTWVFIGHLLGLFATPLKPIALLILLVGMLIQYLAWTLGLGAVVLTGFGLSSPAGPSLTPPAASGTLKAG